MVGLHRTDPSKITMELLTDYVRGKLERSPGNKTAQSLAHMLAGLRVSRYYRMDMPEPGHSLISREFLRGVLTDGPI